MTCIIARKYPKVLHELSNILNQPNLLEYICRFLYDQLNPASDIFGMDAPLDQCPRISNVLRIKVFHSAVSTYFALSDLSGIGGMHREHIRATPVWKNGPGCYDCVFIDKDPDEIGFCGLHVAQVMLFFSFNYQGQDYQCALVHWFTTYSDSPCEDTGLWQAQACVVFLM